MLEELKSLDHSVFKYKTFKIYEIDPQEIMEFSDDSFIYKNKKEAMKHQILDIYNFINKKYSARSAREISKLNYFEKFRNDNDLEFFIINITDGQLDIETYQSIITDLLESNPEYFI